MKENKDKIATAIRNTRAAMWISVAFGCMLVVLSIAAVVGDINLSNQELSLAELKNCNLAGNSYLYPSEGTKYELEARVIDNASANKGDWYRELIAAHYGDTLEIRLKITTADPANIDIDDTRRNMLFACSAGLELLEAAIDHEQIILPDGSLADYRENVENAHVVYLAIGTFRFTSKDWWGGRSASTLIPMNPEMLTKLEVIAPYCDVNPAITVSLLGACIVFGAVIPISFKREAQYLIEHPEEFDDLEEDAGQPAKGQPTRGNMAKEAKK